MLVIITERMILIIQIIIILIMIMIMTMIIIMILLLLLLLLLIIIIILIILKQLIRAARRAGGAPTRGAYVPEGPIISYHSMLHYSIIVIIIYRIIQCYCFIVFRNAARDEHQIRSAEGPMMCYSILCYSISYYVLILQSQFK